MSSRTFPSDAGPPVPVQREIKFRERCGLRVIVEAFNLTNTTNVTDVSNTAANFTATSTSATSPCFAGANTNDYLVQRTDFLKPFATSNRLYGARQMQLSLRFDW